jgi:Abnormal spindle-like microcephaly-assoc'd, ASPM-SPD-2-Hydin
VTNQSRTTPITFASIATSGDFAMATNCGATLRPRAECSVNVRFTPTDYGKREGTLTFDSNASNSPSSIDLIGKGIQGK